MRAQKLTAIEGDNSPSCEAAGFRRSGAEEEEEDMGANALWTVTRNEIRTDFFFFFDKLDRMIFRIF